MMKKPTQTLALLVLSFILCVTLLFPHSLPPPLVHVCSHAGRQASSHRPVYLDDILPSLQSHLSKGVRCFDLDLSPHPSGGGATAVAHPAALLEAASGTSPPSLPHPTLDYPALFSLLASHPGVTLTLELKPPLNLDTPFITRVASAAGAAGVAPRVVLLGIPPGVTIPPHVHYGADVREIPNVPGAERCSMDMITPTTSVCMPSVKCWSDPSVRGKILAWSEGRRRVSGTTTTAPIANGQIHVWVVDDESAARELVALGGKEHQHMVRIITNNPSALGYK